MSRLSSYIHIVLAGVLLSAAISCSEKADKLSDEQSFIVETKAAEAVVPNTTYRVIAYYGTSSTTQRYQYVSSGTYQAVEGERLLVSCELNDDGTWKSDNSASALNGMSGSYYLVLASPGKAINSDGSFQFTPDSESDNLKFNRPMLSTLGGYGAITFTNALYDNRSKMSFKMYKNISDDVENFTVTDAYVTSVNAKNETVKIYPSIRQVKVADLSAHRPVVLTEANKAKDNTGHLLYYESEVLTVASGYFAPKSVVASQLSLSSAAQSYLVESNYIYFGCKLAQGDRDPVSIRIPINATAPELKPQMNYVYRVTISSNFISLAVDIFDASTNPWQDGGSFNESISTPSQSYVVGTWSFNQWGEVNDLTQEII